MTSPSRAPAIIAGMSLGLVAPIAFGSHALFMRPPADVVSDAQDASYPPVVIAAALCALVGWAVVTRRSRASDGLRAAMAWGAVLVGTAAFVLAALRAGDVDRDRLIRDMPVVREIDPYGAPVHVGAVRVSVHRMEDSRVTSSEEPTTDSLGRAFACQVRIATPSRPEMVLPIGSYGTCQRARVRHDPVNGIVVVEHVPLWAMPWSDAWQRLAVVSADDGRPMTLDARAFRRSLAVPREWASLAAFSMAFGFGMLLVALGARRRVARFAPLSDAVHVGDGWFAVRDGRRIHAAWTRDLPLGEFAVRIVEPSESPDYRTSAAPTVEPVERGAASRHATKARGRVAMCEGLALAAAALGMTPAAVAVITLMT